MIYCAGLLQGPQTRSKHVNIQCRSSYPPGPPSLGGGERGFRPSLKPLGEEGIEHEALGKPERMA